MEMREVMKLLEIIEPDFVFADERGLLVQLAHANVAQVNAVFTKKGAVRGNLHYHKHAKETFYILSGKVRVTLELDGQREEAVFGTGAAFRIPENVRHTFAYLEDTYLVGLYSARVELPDGTKDIYT